jgi:hypothetical protein
MFLIGLILLVSYKRKSLFKWYPIIEKW